MKFIDLFAGLGGFHLALSSLSHECVFASEIKEDLASLYETNFNVSGVHCDIKDIHEDDIPPHDIMCAGFPCQPFSKAGKQLGIKDERGQFLVDLERILTKHQPKYFILENVPNLRKHDREETWNNLKSMLENCGYRVYDEILSPHEFGIPQIRKRIYIVGIHNSVSKKFEFPKPEISNSLDIRSILDKNPTNARKMPQERIACTDLWQSIIQEIPEEESISAVPLWSMEFEATYPFEERTPYSMDLNELKKYRGSFGKSLKDAATKEEALELLPVYARTKSMEFPSWKIRYIKQNRELLRKYNHVFSKYVNELMKYPPSWQKLEWNCAGEKRNIYDFLIQFRGSGIRVKRTNYAPALVVNTTQLPIIGWEKRYLTIQEAAKLQDIQEIELPDKETVSIKALGNAVNVHIIYLIAKKLVGKKKGRKKKAVNVEFMSGDRVCQTAL